jgi:hypothetical protein
VGYLSTVSVDPALWRRMVPWLMDDGLGKNLKQSVFGLFQGMFWHSLGRTGENCEINQLGWSMLGRDIDHAPQERKSEKAWQLSQRVQLRGLKNRRSV